jgi:hypothetical protein
VHQGGQRFGSGCALKGSGTLVHWSDLYKVGYSRDTQEQAQKLLRRLDQHLSLAFHRFLSGRARAVRIRLDVFDGKARTTGVPLELEARNPFNYVQ